MRDYKYRFITKLISNVHNSFVGHMGVDKTYA